MPHIRSQLRNALDAHLKASVPSVGGGVFSRFHDPEFGNALDTLEDGKVLLDASISSTTATSDGSASGGPSLQTRSIVIETTLIGIAGPSFEEAAEAAAIEVEAAMEMPSSFKRLVQDLRFAGDEPIEIGAHKRGSVVGLRLRFLALIKTMSGDPTESIARGN